MALESQIAQATPGSQQGVETTLPIFNVERVQLQFNLATDFVAGQVANNVLILALATGRILRIDLESPSDIDDVDLPKRTSEVGVIRRMFLDPSASHLIISTTLGENFYLHTQSKQPKALSRLKGISIECIAWNSSRPTASTREILIGATDGSVYETYIEPGSYRREERYVTQIWQTKGGAVTGLWTDTIPEKPDLRRVVVSSHTKIWHWIGKHGGRGREGSASIYADILQKEVPSIHATTGATGSAPSSLSISPDLADENDLGQLDTDRVRNFAWLYSQGVLTGKLSTPPSTNDLSTKIFDESKLHARSLFPESMSARGGRKLIQDPIQAMTLTQWHVLVLVEGHVIAVNRLDGKIVYDQSILEAGQTALGLVSDPQKNTYWLFTSQEIFEIVANDEERDIWKIMLQMQNYDAALRYAKGSPQKDSVAKASGDFLSSKGQYLEAASVWGKSSKAFEEVCLDLMDHGQEDALKRYLLTKLTSYKKSSVMQRAMISTWLIQLYMAKLNTLDDTVATKAELDEEANPSSARDDLQQTKQDFQDFVTKHKADLDAKTVYEIIASHDREEELLFFADAITDYDYVLSYWVQREKWTEALSVLNKQTNPETFYRYSNVLMIHVPSGLVEILSRRTNIDPQRIIPALLSYNDNANNIPLNQNQALRYLNYVVNTYDDVPASIHNTLISIMASHPAPSESMLLSYLEAQPQPPLFDADFALRLCVQHKRVQSCVHIYSTMGQYTEAVTLALQHNDIDLAAIVADRIDPPTSPLRKKLWLMIARAKIKQTPARDVKSALAFLKRCELLKIQDLIPLLPDFVVIDDFKEEICNALEEYSRHIDNLRTEMDLSQSTASQIQSEIAALDSRFAIIEPGERCWICTLPVLSRQFFVFPCQHAFHSDCLGKRVLETSSAPKRKKIKDLQAEVAQGMSIGPQRMKKVKELDGLVAEQCVLCGDLGIKLIVEPFVRDGEDKAEWEM